MENFKNISVILMTKSGNLINRIDTIIRHISVDDGTLVIKHEHGEITAMHVTVHQTSEFATILSDDQWSITIFCV